MRCTIGSLLTILLATNTLRADTLPALAGIEWPLLRDECRELLRVLDPLKGPFSADEVKTLRDLLDKKPADPDQAARTVQKLLDAHCLVGVEINPESRVKAARGPAATDLRLGTGTVVLLRVHNEAGVTSPLRISGPGLSATRGDDGWLQATILTRARLNGRRLDYVALRLTPREAGKREATFRFDVGQGTQDLGFRAEVPILFVVRNP